MADFEFAGNFSHIIDAKGRATIPAAYRAALEGGFTVALNGDFTAIALYDGARWEEKCACLSRIPESDRLGMRYARLIIGSSFPGCALDAQGRVLLPSALRQRAGLEHDVRFVGMGNYLEIWDEARYQREFESASESIDELLDHVNARYDKVE